MADSSSDSSNSIGAAVGFIFHLAGGSSAEDGASRGSRRAGGIGRVPEGQGVEVEAGVLAVGAMFQRPTPDVGTGFVVVMPV